MTIETTALADSLAETPLDAAMDGTWVVLVMFGFFAIMLVMMAKHLDDAAKADAEDLKKGKILL